METSFDENFQETLPALARLVGLGPRLFQRNRPRPIAGRNRLEHSGARDANAFSTSLRYDSSGNLYAWDGLNVWKQSGGTGVFNNIGSVTAGNSADAGPISFSQDGQSLLLSNGSGGYTFRRQRHLLDHAGVGRIGHAVAGSGVPYAYDALALPAASTIPGSGTKYIVNAGTSDYIEQFVVDFRCRDRDGQGGHRQRPRSHDFDRHQSEKQQPLRGRRLRADAGNIYSFSLSQIDSAYNSGTPIDFLAGGTLFNPTGTGSQSGAGMFFDNDGYLFSGGDGITVFRPDGTICYDQPSGGGRLL